MDSPRCSLFTTLLSWNRDRDHFPVHQLFLYPDNLHSAASHIRCSATCVHNYIYSRQEPMSDRCQRWLKRTTTSTSTQQLPKVDSFVSRFTTEYSFVWGMLLHALSQSDRLRRKYISPGICVCVMSNYNHKNGKEKKDTFRNRTLRLLGFSIGHGSIHSLLLPLFDFVPPPIKMPSTHTNHMFFLYFIFLSDSPFILKLVLFYARAIVFQLDLGGDMYEMRRKKIEPTVLPTQGIFYLPHHIGMA